MADQKTTGIFWGDNKIFCVETVDLNTHRIFEIPFDASQNALMQGDEFTTSGTQITEDIMNSLKHYKIKTRDFNLALPPKDTIFRSFVIPWMPANEIKGAVDFEASKYIPFSLKELKYCYHSIPISQGTTKRLHIIFVAIKINTLQQYTKILEKAAISIKSIEPSQLSLIRTLKASNTLPENEIAAIADYDDESGKITIVHREIPLFVREFQLKTVSAEGDQAPININQESKLINELKISLDYFARQVNTAPASLLILVSKNIDAELKGHIQSDLNINVLTLSSKQVIGHPDAEDVNYLCAYGAAIFEKSSLNADLNFSDRKTSRSKSKKKPNAKVDFSLKSVIPVTIICILLTACAFYITNKSVSTSQQKVDQIKNDLGEYVSMDTETIELLNSKLQKKQKHFKEVRIKSTIATFLANIPKLLPPGTWVENFDISYSEPGNIDKPILQMNGYVYHENVNEQFRLVYRFQKNMQEDTLLSDFFSNIDIVTTESKQLSDYDVTYFKIKCQ